MLAWLGITVLLVIAPRLLFAKASIVPHLVPYNPGVAFIPVFAIYFGPAGVWGAAIASVLGDLLCDIWGPVIIFRAAGWFFAAWFLSQIAHPFRSPKIRSARRLYLPLIGSIFLASIVSASWAAMGAEMLGLYPFSYTFYISLIHHSIFCVGFGLLLYRLMLADLAVRTPTWESVINYVDRIELSIRLMGITMLIACLLVLLVAWLFSTIGFGHLPFKPSVIGTSHGVGLEFCIIPLMLLQLMAVFWPDSQLPPPASGQLGNRHYTWSSLLR